MLVSAVFKFMSSKVVKECPKNPEQHTDAGRCSVQIDICKGCARTSEAPRAAKQHTDAGDEYSIGKDLAQDVS